MASVQDYILSQLGKDLTESPTAVQLTGAEKDQLSLLLNKPTREKFSIHETLNP